MPDLATLDALPLPELEQPMGYATLHTKRRVAIRAIDGEAMEILEAMEAGRLTARLRDRLLALCLPDATPAERQRITMPTLGKIIEAASGQYEAVMAWARAQGFSTAPETAAPPPDAPADGSAPSTSA